MKLKTKIQLFTGLFMFILILIINTSIYYLFYHVSAKNELEELVKETYTIVEALNVNEDLSKSDMLKAFLPPNGTIRVINEEGQAVIPLLRKADADHNIPFHYTTTESRLIYKDGSGANSVVISKPIIWENGEIVTLQVSNHLISLQKTMGTLLYVLIIASVIILIPTIIAGRVLSQFLLRPIQTLIQTMRENTEQAQWKKINIVNETGDELYEMEKTFNIMIDHIKENFAKQEQFVSDASHELRTPISIVKSYAQLLQRRGKTHPEIFEEAVEAIDTEADHMERLVQQLFLIAKNKKALSFEIIDFNFICKKVVKKVNIASKHKVTFENQSQPVKVKGNESLLQQLIYILLDNALKYSEDTVEVSLLKKEDKISLYVRDYGPGIPLKEQEKIFDRFYRLDQARSRQTGGSGLGLSIAQTIAQMHEGQLFVQSDGKKWFNIYLLYAIN